MLNLYLQNKQISFDDNNVTVNYYTYNANLVEKMPL